MVCQQFLATDVQQVLLLGATRTEILPALFVVGGHWRYHPNNVVDGGQDDKRCWHTMRLMNWEARPFTAGAIDVPTVGLHLAEAS